MSTFLHNSPGVTYFYQTILGIHSLIHLFSTPSFSQNKGSSIFAQQVLLFKTWTFEQF